MHNKIYEKVIKYIKDNKVFLISLVVIIFLFYFKLPYSIETPGGTINLNERVIVNNKNTTTGSLNMAYVSVLEGTIPFLGLSYIIPNWDIIKNDDFKLNDETMENMYKRNRLYYEESIDSATIVAFHKANKEIEITHQHINIIYIAPEAKTSLKLYDEIISVEGKKINSLTDYLAIVNRYEIGDTINIKVQREKKEINVIAEVINIAGEKKTGVVPVITYDYKTSIPIKIDSKKTEYGSSGGLMMALSIYDQLNKKDLTKNKTIVGTGTIDSDGNVGEIDGVKYKIIGAHKKKADVFLCPKGNYKEAKKIVKENNYSIKLVSVETIDDAIAYLEK